MTLGAAGQAACHWRCVFLAWLMLAMLTPLAIAQTPKQDAGKPLAAASLVEVNATRTNSVDAMELRARIEQLKGRNDMSASERDLALDQLVAALGRAESAEIASHAAQAYTEDLKTAPETIAALQAEVALLQVPEVHDVPVDLSENLSDDMLAVQLRLAALQAEAVSLRSRQRTLQEELAAMATRPAEARAELADLRKQRDKEQSALPVNASPLLVEASRLRADAAREDYSARIEKTEQELLTLPTRETIARAKLDLRTRQSEVVEARVVAMQTRMNAQRDRDAARQQQAAQDMLQRLAGHPATVRELAIEVTDLREVLVQVTRQLDALHAEKEHQRSQLQAVEEARRTTDQIFSLGQVGDENGLLLRGVSRQLPAQGELDRRIAARDASIVVARVRRLKNQQILRELQEPTAVARNYLVEAGIPVDDALMETMTSLVLARRAALDDLQALDGQWAEELATANALDGELRQRATQLSRLLEERLLWMPSAKAVNTAWLRKIGQGAAWLASPGNWKQVSTSLFMTLKTRWPSLVLLLGAFAGLMVTGKRLRRALEAAGKPVDHRKESFGQTWRALAITVLLALPFPLLIQTVGWSLRQSSQAGEFANALGSGLISAGALLFMLGIFQAMCRRDGLFRAHFGWDENGTRRLGRALRLLAVMLVPAALITVMTHTYGSSELDDGLGRLGLMTGSLALALFIYRVFRPGTGALTDGLDHNGAVWRSRYIWFWGLVAMPLLLALMAATGYFATARTLQERLFTSGWIFLAIIIAYQIAMRGVLIAGRHEAYRQADARRSAAIAEALKAAESTEATDGSEALALQNKDQEIDMVTVSQHTRALLRAAAGVAFAVLLWGIWGSMLPALNVFGDVVLWSHVVTTSAGDSVAAVSLGDLLMALLIVALTLIASRNLPGFLEIILLQRMSKDAGTRYAISTIGRYGILAIGLIWAFSFIGADWSKLQWIVAALGVGLGFGLQEIVANFVSGLIILFERPVRVGDLVTIGTTSGTVTRIRIRAITITDFDNFEVIVPNKAFITGPVQNWTLTTPITRLVIKIGIGYDSDVAKAQQLMLKVATRNLQVLSTPAPSVLFMAFGDSALEFQIRAYVGKVDQRASIQHELNTALIAALTKAGISIPFPQRDVHVHYLDKPDTDAFSGTESSTRLRD